MQLSAEEAERMVSLLYEASDYSLHGVVKFPLFESRPSQLVYSYQQEQVGPINSAMRVTSS